MIQDLFIIEIFKNSVKYSELIKFYSEYKKKCSLKITKKKYIILNTEYK